MTTQTAGATQQVGARASTVTESTSSWARRGGTRAGVKPRSSCLREHYAGPHPLMQRAVNGRPRPAQRQHHTAQSWGGVPGDPLGSTLHRNALAPVWLRALGPGSEIFSQHRMAAGFGDLGPKG